MSFVLELQACPDSWEQAGRAVMATSGAGFVSVVAGGRDRLGRELKPSLRFDWDDAYAVLDDQAGWDEPAFTFTAGGRAALAATVLALGDVLSAGWGLRAYWLSDP